MGTYKLIQAEGCQPRPLLVMREGSDSDARKAGLDDKQRQKVEEMLTKALATRPSASEGANRGAKPSKMDEATLRRLKSLGYVQ